MANLREPYAATALASLAWDELAEKPIDRVAASGKVSALGLLLWKLKYQNESRAYARAHGLLYLAYRRKWKADTIMLGQKLCEQALLEYVATSCRACSGKGEVMFDERLVTCTVCEGSKLHRYSDIERARRMQLSYGLTKVCAYKIRWLSGLLESEDRAVNSVMNEQLERE